MCPPERVLAHNSNPEHLAWENVCLYATAYVKPLLERTAQRVPSAFQTMQPAIQGTHSSLVRVFAWIFQCYRPKMQGID